MQSIIDWYVVIQCITVFCCIQVTDVQVSNVGTVDKWSMKCNNTQIQTLEKRWKGRRNIQNITKLLIMILVIQVVGRISLGLIWDTVLASAWRAEDNHENPVRIISDGWDLKWEPPKCVLETVPFSWIVWQHAYVRWVVRAKLRDLSVDGKEIFFFPMPPHVPYGLCGLPSQLWLKCNRLLRLGRPWGTVTLSRWCGWWYMNMKYQEGP
jgi:hypothetical protein